jgi:hypothetical protein
LNLMKASNSHTELKLTFRFPKGIQRGRKREHPVCPRDGELTEHSGRSVLQWID